MLALVLISRLISRSRALYPSISSMLCKNLELAGRVGIPVDGKPQEPPFPGLPSGPWETHWAGLRRHRLTQLDLRASFLDLERQSGEFAHFAPELINDFVPDALWPVLAHIAHEGPGRAARRAQNALWSFASTSVRPNKRRGAGPPALGTLNLVRQGFRRLFREFVRLGNEPGFSVLAAWSSVPEIQMPDAPTRERDYSAPRPEEQRLALARLNESIASRLGISPGEDELEALSRMTRTAISEAHLFRLVRARATLVLVSLLAGRITAIDALRRSDFIDDRAGPPPDSRHGYAIKLRPGKTLPIETVRFKPLPTGAAEVIEVYLKVLEITSEITRRCHPGKTGLGPVPSDPPLLVSDTLHFQPFGERGIRRLLSGAQPIGDGKGAPPLIVRADTQNGDLPEQHRQYLGYQPTAYRRAGSLLAEAAGRAWNRDHPPDSGEPAAEPKLYGSALLDHKIPGESLRALYGGWNEESKYELLSGRAIEGTWRILTTDEGARRRPPLASIRAGLERLKAIEDDISFRQEEADALYSRCERLVPPKVILQPYEPGIESEFEYLARQNSALLEGQDRQHVAMGEMESRLSQMHRLADHIGRFERLRGDLKSEIQNLVHDRRRWELIPDDAPAGVESADVDIEGLLEEGPPTSPAPQPIRWWLLAGELAELAGVSRPTVTRWINGELHEDPRKRPWDRGETPIDESLGQNWRRIWVGGIKPEFWPTEATRGLLAERLSGWPNGPGWSKVGEPGERCSAPLLRPTGEPFPTLDLEDAMETLKPKVRGS